MLSPLQLLVPNYHFLSRGIYLLLISAFLPIEVISTEVLVGLELLLEFVLQP